VIKKKNLSKEDTSTWENYVKNPTDIFDKEKNSIENKEKKFRFKFDLHGYSLNDANQKVKEIILYCSENKFKEILLITGKGMHSTSDEDVYISKELGKLKFSVPEYIESDQELRKLIISVRESEVKDGGSGAIIIKLRNL
tara:strand:- start:491 stop:910 length:420 start_codon:yes stop_codon:yes gene_type:complete